jgi:hypothetical protein
MAITIHTQWESGHPCRGVIVTVHLDGGDQGEAPTDANGDVRFALGRGHGAVFCDGQEVWCGELPTKLTLVCKEAPLYVWIAEMSQQPDISL